MSLHKILEEHAGHFCTNADCGRCRNGENLISQFEDACHYVTWTCDGCGQKQWWKTKELSSGILRSHITVKP